MKKFLPKSAKAKLRSIKRVLKRGASVSEACREVGIARITYYRWQKRQAEGKPSGYRKLKSARRKAQALLEKKLLRLVVANPHLACCQLAERLGKSQSFTWKILNKHNLGTRKLRRRWARKIGIYPVKKQKYRREFGTRVMLLERAQKVGVSQACREFEVSRMLFYKWKRRQLAGEPLENRKWQVLRWGRQTPEKYEGIVLKLVIRYPEFSVHRLVPILPKIAGKSIVGHHGVQNILRRNGLNTFDRRLEYARLHAPVSLVQPITGWLNRLKTVWQTFVPTIAPAPPPPLRFWLRGARPFFLSFLSSSVLTLIFLFWFSMLSGQPFSTKLGLFFASISLSCGTFFFLYSMKYYFTLAVVLSFSRQPLNQNEFGSGQAEEGGGLTIGLNGRIGRNGGNGNGWLARIFGLRPGGPQGPEGLNGSLRGPGPPPAGGLQPNLEHIKLKRYPFVSIHLPFYNEKKVAERILKACTSIDYPPSPSASVGASPNFEIIVCDDSTDETTTIIQRFADQWNARFTSEVSRRRNTTSEVVRGPIIKVIHRSTRSGFKGGALGEALKHMDPRTEFVVVFDADFIPYPDTLELFMKYFQANGLDLSKNYTSEVEGNKIACVAGYQWHVLNKSENWITRGVRTEYAGSYVIERPGQEILGAMKLIHGSIYCIRADVLKKFGWGTSITEDFELTLRLYAQGYKVIYTPYIQAPAECVSTLKRLIRQRMRWSEGHSHCIKRMFFKLLSSPKMSLTEKLEFLYLSPYYLQAFFFLIGTFSWLLAETVFRVRLPFWTSLWGWSLVLTNFFSLPLVNAVGLFLEESEEKDYLGILSFIALSYILVPFQAYASVKGFIEKQEGPWFRTPKTGLITDIFTRGRFYRWIRGILPGRRLEPALAMVIARNKNLTYGENLVSRFARNELRYSHLNPYVALRTANNRFDKPPVPRGNLAENILGGFWPLRFFSIRLAKRYLFSKAVLASFLLITMFLNYLAIFTIVLPGDSEVNHSGGIVLYQSEPEDTNLKENSAALQLVQGKPGVVYAADGSINSPQGEIYRWQVKAREEVYSFGLQEAEGIKPVVKMRNRWGWFVKYAPISADYVEPKVEENKIEWKLGEGITAKYTALEDRIKADYILDERSAIGALEFKINFHDSLKLRENNDGTISWLVNEGKEIFKFPLPEISDAKEEKISGAFSLKKIGQKEAFLRILIPEEFLEKALFPLTVDPTVLNSSVTDQYATLYSGGRHLVRTVNGKLVACYIDVNKDVGCRASSDNGVNWGTEAIITAKAFRLAISPDNTTNDIFHLGYIEEPAASTLYGTLKYFKGTLSGTTISFSSGVDLDTSNLVRNVSIVTDSENDRPAIAWSMGKSTTPKRTDLRFMRCDVGATDCDTAITNWCNAAGTSCGTAATSATDAGSADVVYTVAAHALLGVALEQMPGSGTRSKDLYVWFTVGAGGPISYNYADWDGVDDWVWQTNTQEDAATSGTTYSPMTLSSLRDETNNVLVFGYLDENGTTDNFQVYHRDTSNTRTDRGTPFSTTSLVTVSFAENNGAILAIGDTFQTNLQLKKNSSGTTWSSTGLDIDVGKYTQQKFNGAGSKLDFIYQTGASPYAVEYHTFHLEETRAVSSETSLPTDDSISLTGEDDYFFDELDYTNTASANNSYDDGVTADSATAYLVYYFKDTHTNTTDYFTPEWEGQFSQACSASYPAKLQIYNRNTPAWEDVASSTTCSASTDFSLSGTVDTNLSYYYGTDSWIGSNAVAFRVYKQSSTTAVSGKTDYFTQNANLFIPERVLLLLLLVPFLPKIVKKLKRRGK